MATVFNKLSLKFSGKISGESAEELMRRARELFDDLHEADKQSRVDLSITSHSDKKGEPIEISIGKF